MSTKCVDAVGIDIFSHTLEPLTLDILDPKSIPDQDIYTVR